MSKGKPFLRSQGQRYTQRSTHKLQIRQRFLIVCEGKKTEPNYFIKFRTPHMIVNVEGLGMNTLSLVQRTIEISLSEDSDFDQIWCVFDKDDFSNSDFLKGISLAKRNKIKVAYSNQAFELWYVLHFCYMQNAISRSDYKKILEGYLNHKYEKNSTTIYDELRPFQTDAIRNAKRLLAQYNPSRPEIDDPATLVHLLVEQLNKYSG